MTGERRNGKKTRIFTTKAVKNAWHTTKTTNAPARLTETERAIAQRGALFTFMSSRERSAGPRPGHPTAAETVNQFSLLSEARTMITVVRRPQQLVRPLVPLETAEQERKLPHRIAAAKTQWTMWFAVPPGNGIIPCEWVQPVRRTGNGGTPEHSHPSGRAIRDPSRLGIAEVWAAGSHLGAFVLPAANSRGLRESRVLHAETP